MNRKAKALPQHMIIIPGEVLLINVLSNRDSLSPSAIRAINDSMRVHSQKALIIRVHRTEAEFIKSMSEEVAL